MKSFLIKFAILAGCFFAAAFITSGIINKDSVDLTSELSEASLPVIYMLDGDEKLNTMYGYTEEMDSSSMRGYVCVADDSHSLSFKVETYGYTVDSIEYEIRSLDSARLVENGSPDIDETKSDSMTMHLSAGNLLSDDSQYMLIISLLSGEDTVRYYTRIALNNDYHVEDCIDFALDFHAKSMDSSKLDSLSTYLEPDSAADNTTLNRVTINSSLSQVGWGDFEGSELSSPVVNVSDISPYFNSLSLRYVMTSTSAEGAIEYYNVTENFCLRYTSDRIYLLDYERTMNRIFGDDTDPAGSDYLQLGIRDGDIEYEYNSTGTCVLWVQEGELFSYNSETNSVSPVFSYRSSEGIDARENNGNHGIKLIGADESGSADFIVYGYFNRGEHEGKTGVSVYHYDSNSNYIEEELFIPSDLSYEVLKEDLGELLYISNSNTFFMIVDNALYKVDLTKMSSSVLTNTLSDGSYTVSETGQHIAWTEEDSPNIIHEYDLDTEEQTDLKLKSSKYARTLCYMNEDLIYGWAAADDVSTDQTGSIVCPMKKLFIKSSEGETLKTYSHSGYRIMDAYVLGGTIYLSLAKASDENYAISLKDTIVNNDAATDEIVYIDSTITDGYEKQYQIKFSFDLAEKTPKLVTPSLIATEDENTVDLALERSADTWYAYAYGKITLSSETLADAIASANDTKGVVTDSSLNVMWARARASARSPLTSGISISSSTSGSLARAISVILSLNGEGIDVDDLLSAGNTATEILDGLLVDKTILDLSGCTLSQTLYYISEGSPVLAMTGKNKAVLIVGYDSSNVYVYLPENDSVQTYLLSSYEDTLSEKGNKFISYSERQK